MEPIRLSDAVEVRPDAFGGIGMFAKRDIAEGETIEVAPVRPIYAREVVRTKAIYHYWFAWDPPRTDEDEPEVKGAQPHGYAGIYNHSPNPNLRYQRLYDQSCLHFIARRDIKADEELCHDYQWDAKHWREVLGVEDLSPELEHALLGKPLPEPLDRDADDLFGDVEAVLDEAV